MIKTAVIGASGYIGSHLFKKYRETFPDCIGTSYSRANDQLTGFDLRYPNIQTLHLTETGHQAVIIASAMSNVGWCESHPKESYELNVKGTLNLVRQLEEHSLTTIFLSSDYVFDGKAGTYSDKENTCPITEYGRQKAEVEREIANVTSNYIILRLSKIYGTKWKDNTLIDSLAFDLLNNKKVMLATDQFFSPTHVNDVVSMTLLAQQLGVKGLFNLCHPISYSRYHIAHKLAVALNVSSSLVESVSLHHIPGMENRPLNTSLQPSTLFQKIEHTFISIDAAIQQVALNWKEDKLTSETMINYNLDVI
jgi:dTDP-4-dehydrorhamnose reductase